MGYLLVYSCLLSSIRRGLDAVAGMHSPPPSAADDAPQSPNLTATVSRRGVLNLGDDNEWSGNKYWLHVRGYNMHKNVRYTFNSCTKVPSVAWKESMDND